MSEMKLFYLGPRKYECLEKWPDNCAAFAVVVAKDEDEARLTESEYGGEVWLDKSMTVCHELRADAFDVRCVVLDNASLTEQRLTDKALELVRQWRKECERNILAWRQFVIFVCVSSIVMLITALAVELL